MCVAIYKPAGIVLDKSDLYAAYTENADGCGFTVREHGTLTTVRGVSPFEKFWTAYQRHMYKEAIIHFRYATAGAVDTANCHPFPLANGARLIHNGHIRGYGTATMSDTRQWIDTTLNPLLKAYPSALTNAGIRQMLEAFLAPSKVVILPAYGDVIILNETSGTWENDVWYSNTYYRVPAKYTTPYHDDRCAMCHILLYRDEEGICRSCEIAHTWRENI